MATEPGGETPAEQRRLDRATALVAALLALVGYGASLPARITFGGDCGELTAAAWCLGVPHPTGYPLWLMLAKASSLLLPYGTVAWRVAALSALCGALTVGFGTWLVVRATADRVAGLVAGITLLCCGTVGSQATIAEVYALQLAILAALLFAHHEWIRTRDQRWWALIGLGYGLALTCHVSVVLFAPGTLAVLALTARGPAAGQPRAGQAAWRVLVWALPPLLLYGLLPLRASLGPALNTGATDTLGGFVSHLTGRIYRGYLGQVGAGELLRYVGNHLYYLLADLRWAALLAVAGAWSLGSARQPMAAVLLPGAVLALGFAGLYRVGDRANYVLPVYLVAAILAGYGTAWLRGRLLSWRPELSASGQTSYALIVLLLPLLPSWPGWTAALTAASARTSMAGNDRAGQLLDAILDAAPPEAAVLVLSDEVAYGLWYEQVVEGRRRDLLVGALGKIETPEGWARCRRAIAQQAATRPVAVAFWEPRLLAEGRWNWAGPLALGKRPTRCRSQAGRPGSAAAEQTRWRVPPRRVGGYARRRSKWPCMSRPPGGPPGPC